MADAGAKHRIAQSGSLIIRGLSELPPELQAMFLDADQRSLVAAARAHLASITARL
jgi:hypothetical protein